jgi:Tol biopolymer transport system component/DNA-binding winged helix-turn-helix (wHTH) protein
VSASLRVSESSDRLRLILRGCAQLEGLAQRSNRYFFGAFEFDPRTGELWGTHGLTVLQQQPAAILCFLLEHPGDLVSREELVGRLWPTGTFVDFDRSLNKAVNKLRDALGDSPEEPAFIETLPRRGYRFIAPVTVDCSQSFSGTSVSPPANGPFFATRSVPVTGSSTQSVPRHRTKLFAIVVGGAAVLAVISLAASWLPRHRLGANVNKLQLTKLTDNRSTEHVAISPDGRYIVYAKREASGLGLWVRQVATGGSGVRIVPPESAYFAGLTFSSDSNYVYFVSENRKEPGVSSLFVTPVLGGPVSKLLSGIESSVSFSPDGQQVVFTHGLMNQDAVEVRIAGANGINNQLLATLRGATPFHQSGPAWSPDGRTVAISLMLIGKTTQWVLETISIANGTVRELYSAPYKIGRPLWLPKGDGLLAALDDENNHGQLFVIPFPKGEPQRVTNDLADYDDDRIDLTRDGKTAAIVVWDETGDIWQAPAAEINQAQQLESSGVALNSVASRLDGKILATDLDNRLWVMNADGAQRSLFTDVHPASTPFVCGRFTFFFRETIQGDSQGLMRAEDDGTNVTKLVGGQLGSAACSADGKFVFYDDEHPPQKIYKIPVEGGAPRVVAYFPPNAAQQQLTVSPDGRFLAYLYLNSDQLSAASERLAVVSADGGPPVRDFPMPRGISRLRWSPDGKRLQFSMDILASAATNLWEQSLAGGQPKRMTNFTSGRIFDFDWSADGTRLLMIRGDLNGDVVLVRNFR